MRLYHHPLSTCSRRVRLAAHQLDIDLELVVVDLSQGRQHDPSFLQLNPNHRVPVLVDGDLVLWESCAIMQYLADLRDGTALYPRLPKARADINRWLFWCGHHLMPGAAVLNWEHTFKGMLGQGAGDPAEIARGNQLLRTAGTVLESHLAIRPWLCGDQMTLADLALAAPLADQERSHYPTVGFPAVQRWFDQVRQLPAWSATAS